MQRMGELLEKIKDALKNDKRSLRELEALTGVSNAMIYQIKAGNRIPNVDIAEKIAKLYGILD